MIAKKIEEVSRQKVEENGAQGAQIRWLLTKDDGAPTFAMRELQLETGGFTPLHQHPWEHEVYVLEGTGVVRGGNDEQVLSPGAVILVPPDELHQFRNTGKETLRFLCLIPVKKD
jgi:quercetin dioxygenase-like cupin family protein